MEKMIIFCTFARSTLKVQEMTEHQKAIIKALVDLDGKGSNKEIYRIAKKYANYGGSTPNNTIRRDLQQSKFIRPVEGCKGYWELIPFNGIVEELLSQNQKQASTISELKEAFKESKMFCEFVRRYLLASSQKTQVKREQIKAIVIDMANHLKFVFPPDVQELVNSFDDEKSPSIMPFHFHASGSMNIENIENVSEIKQKEN